MPNRELLERARMFEERAERATDPISRQHYRETAAHYRALSIGDGHAGARDGALSIRILYFSEMHQTTFEPCIPTKVARVPDRPEWIYEIKHDGYRLIVERDGKRVRLWTRNGHDWSGRFPLITEAALRNRNSSFVIDGEAGARRRWPVGFQRPALAPAGCGRAVVRLRYPGERRRGSLCACSRP